MKAAFAQVLLPGSTARRWSDAQIDAFFDGLRQEVATACPEGPDAVQLAIYLWTSFQPVLDGRELCFQLSDVMRTDDKNVLGELLPYILLQNYYLGNRNKHDKDAIWPKDS